MLIATHERCAAVDASTWPLSRQEAGHGHFPGYRERDVSHLSGGEAQRVSLARTLANAPVALLLDEPTSALDEASSRAIEELLLGIVRERQTVCAIVTHNTTQAHRIADRAMIIEKGRLISVGSAKEVLDAYKEV